jgi:ABC-type uncharacterized transport system permease subunit
MFFASGTYAFGLLMQKAGTSIPTAFLLTILISAALATVVGAICVRLKEIYFSFITLAFQMLLHSLIISWQQLTGGDQGLMGGIPRPPFLGINLADQSHLYLFACATLVVSLLIMRHLMQSPFGAARDLSSATSRAARLPAAAIEPRRAFSPCHQGAVSVSWGKKKLVRRAPLLLGTICRAEPKGLATSAVTSS